MSRACSLFHEPIVVQLYLCSSAVPFPGLWPRLRFRWPDASQEGCGSARCWARDQRPGLAVRETSRQLQPINRTSWHALATCIQPPLSLGSVGASLAVAPEPIAGQNGLFAGEVAAAAAGGLFVACCTNNWGFNIRRRGVGKASVKSTLTLLPCHVQKRGEMAFGSKSCGLASLVMASQPLSSHRCL